MTYIKENIIAKLQKLCSQLRNLRVGNKLPEQFLKTVCTETYCPHAKYSLKGLWLSLK